MDKKKDIAAIIVTYRTKKLLKTCLTSLINDLSNSKLAGEIIVVDNASEDGTVEMIQKEFPFVYLIANKKNFGPAKAFNQGISAGLAKADCLLLANSDIEIIPGTLATMWGYLQKNSKIAGVNGPLLNEDHTRQFTKTHIWCFWRPNLKKEFRTEFIGTTFAMIRKEAFCEVGGYDENYYFYNEDLDWAERAKRARLAFRYLPGAPVVHFLSKGSSQNKSKILHELYRSNLYYYKKFYRPLVWLVFLIMKFEIMQKISLLKKRFLTESTLDPDAKSNLETQIYDLQIARDKMRIEFRTKRSPAVPFWEEKRK